MLLWVSNLSKFKSFDKIMYMTPILKDAIYVFTVNETGDTDADREARALLNKFLGASVILQAMEAGGRATNGSAVPDGTPGSAALVSSVEKQRKVRVMININFCPLRVLMTIK